MEEAEQDEAFRALVAALAVIMVWPKPKVAATLQQTGKERRHISVDPFNRTWAAVQDPDNYQSYTPDGGFVMMVDGRIAHEVPAEEYDDPQRHGTVPAWLQIAVPEELPIWGGITDSWRIVGAEFGPGADRITVHLDSVGDERRGEYSARLVLDTNRLIAVGLYVEDRHGTPRGTTELVDIEFPYKRARGGDGSWSIVKADGRSPR